MNAVLEYINSAGRGFVGFAGPMLLQSSVLIVILLIVDLLLRKKVRAVLRYWLWMLVLVKLVLPTTLSSPVSLGFLLPVEFPASQVTETRTTGDVQTVLPAKMEARASEPMNMPAMQVPVRNSEAIQVRASTVSSIVTWQGVVFVVWAGVAIVMVLLLLQRVVFVCGLVAQAKEANVLMNDTLKYCCGQMGVKGTIRLKVSANATSPAVCGLYRPVILVPENLGASLGAEHLRTVLLHELAHIKRGDLWVNLVQTLLQIVYFYNPLLWLANAMIRRVREQAVDEAVLVAMGERAQQYPETLLNVAKLAFKRPALSLRLIGVVESKSALSGRIKHILSRPIPKSAKLGIWGLAAVLIFGAVLLPMAKANSSNESFDVPKEFVGHWKGQGKIIVNWTKQRWLEIDIEIKPDSTVTGQVGDSQLRNAAFKLRDWLTRKFNPKSNWIVRGDLIGPIIKNENIKREYINLLFDDIGADGKIKGGFHTSGWDMGNKETMIMSGTAMVLKKVSADISETPKKSDFIATLPNGVTVELVGVCEHPSEGKQWWRPDGSVLDQQIITVDSSNYTNKASAYEIAYKISAPNDVTISDFPRIKGSVAQSGLTVEKPSGLRVVRAHIDKWGRTTTISFPIAAGQWKTLGITSGKGQTNTQIGSGKLMFGPAEGTKQKLILTVSDDIETSEDYRLIGIDKAGNIHKSSCKWFSVEGLRQSTFVFTNLELGAIDHFEFQTRPYEYVEFKNVSLKPNFKTDVQVESIAQPMEESAVNKKEADEKRKTEGTSEDSGKPRVVSVRPSPGSQMALISELHIVFDQPMVADKFRIVDPVLKDRPYMSTLSKCGVFYSQVVYDANNYEFIMPLTLPPNWNGSVEFNGFTTVKGVESEPIRLDYSTIREPFSADLLKRFEKARESEELKMLIQNVKTKRSSLKSLSEVVHISYDYPKQELADKRQIDLEHNKEMSDTATFKMQGDKQFYVDVSGRMKGPFYIGSDGEKCWFYNSFKKEGKLVMAESDEIDVKKISICNPFCISETDAATAIKKNNLEYIGVDVRDGRRCYLVRSWSADLNMERATCIAKLWWIDAETYMVSEIISDLGHSILSRRFVYEGVNQAIPDSEFRPDFVKGIAPEQPEPLGEGYNMRFINVKDGSCGRMNVRWGKQGTKGTSDSGLSGP